jgi:hypothetical protein
LGQKLDEVETAAKRQVQKYLRRKGYGPPPDAREIGLHFELEEFQRLRQEAAPKRWRVLHRYPSIESAIPYLRANNISCDIDVADQADAVQRCVEVKAVGGAPGSPFILTRREWASREWCRGNNVPYDIVVYYHVRCQIIERRVINTSEVVQHEPMGYRCVPPAAGY